jgi:thiamine pyrophosphate-dependent acetolactate synthase large subunit-like protein
MTGGEIVLRCLLAQGVKLGFGIPGALNAHLYDALHRVPEFRHILVRHELGGAWMADGYARASNDVGVAFTVPGPGATHAVSAVAGAYTDCSRLLLISSQSESRLRGELRRDLFHGLDQLRLFAPITKWNAAVQHVDEIAPVLAEAFRHLYRDRPGPVHVEIPADVLGQDGGEPEIQRPEPPDDWSPCETDLLRAHELLAAARRPLILAGDGVAHSDAARDLLIVLTEMLRAPVITTVLSKGVMPEDHPWSLGDSNSAAGSQAYQEHDVLLAVGERFTQVDIRWPWFFPPRRLIHMDEDEREIGRVFRPEIGMRGKLSASLWGLLRHLGPAPGDRSGWDDLMPDLKTIRGGRKVHPLLAALRAALPLETIVSFDVCVPGFHSRSDWYCYEPRSYLYPGVYVGMGFGLPAGIGAQLAWPERPVCVVAGDGGFQMTMAELGTAAQYNLPLIVVVVNDGGLTLIRRVQDRDFAGRRCEVDLANPDFTALAAAYGIHSERVESPEALRVAVAAAVERRKLSFIELRAFE